MKRPRKPTVVPRKKPVASKQRPRSKREYFGGAIQGTLDVPVYGAPGVRRFSQAERRFVHDMMMVGAARYAHMANDMRSTPHLYQDQPVKRVAIRLMLLRDKAASYATQILSGELG